MAARPSNSIFLVKKMHRKATSQARKAERIGNHKVYTRIEVDTSWSTKGMHEISLRPDYVKMERRLDDDIESSVAPEFQAEVATGHLLHGKAHIL